MPPTERSRPPVAGSGVLLFFVPVAQAAPSSERPQGEEGAQEAGQGRQDHQEVQRQDALAQELMPPPQQTSPTSSGAAAAEPDGDEHEPTFDAALDPPPDGDVVVDGGAVVPGGDPDNNDDDSSLFVHPAQGVESSPVPVTVEHRRVYSTQTVVAGHKWSLLVFPGGNCVDGQVSAYLCCGGPAANYRDSGVDMYHCCSGEADSTGATHVACNDGQSDHCMATEQQQSPADQADNIHQSKCTTMSSRRFSDPSRDEAIARCLQSFSTAWGSEYRANRDDFVVVDVRSFEVPPQEHAPAQADTRTQTSESHGVSSALPDFNLVVKGILTLFSAQDAQPHLEKAFSHRFSRDSDDWGFREMLSNGWSERAGYIHDNGCLLLRAEFNVFDARYSDLETQIETACALRYIDWLSVIAAVHEMPILADYKTDVDSSQRSLLHLAARKRKREYSSYLLHQGADVNSQDGKLRTPLHIAVDNEDVELVRTLVLKHAADVDAADGSGETPLFNAVRLAASNKDMAQTLVECLVRECGADINAINSKGRTALFSAARIGVLEFVYWLVLELKADCSITDNDGDNAASRAEQYHHEDVAMFLYEAVTSQYP